LGKTLLSLSFLSSSLSENPSLVICNKSIIITWIQEINKFFKNTISYIVLHKDFISNPELYKMDDFKKYKIVITTYDFIRKMWENDNKIKSSIGMKRKYTSLMSLKNIKRTNIYTNEEIYNKKDAIKYIGPSKNYTFENNNKSIFFNDVWGTIILDESQKIKSKISKTTRACVSLVGENYFCLSGTPFQNRASDLYTQLAFCGYNGNPISKIFENDFAKKNLLCRFVFLTKKDIQDVVKFGNIEYKIVYVDLNEKDKKIYDFLYGNLLNLLKQLKKYDDESDITKIKKVKNSALSAIMILRQSVNTNWHLKVLNMYSDYINSKRSMKSSKIIEILKIIKKKKNEKFLIFSFFKNTLYALYELLRKDYKIEIITGDTKIHIRQDIIQRYQSGLIDIILLSYGVGSEGLNLQKANNIIIVEPYWHTKTEKQAIARTYRIGNLKNIKVYKIIANNTIDNYMLHLQEKKGDIERKFLGRYDKDLIDLMQDQ
jgi:SNF2 family DNA or RNA helicase